MGWDCYAARFMYDDADDKHIHALADIDKYDRQADRDGGWDAVALAAMSRRLLQMRLLQS